MRNPFYYGIFRFNGRTYQGSHTPLISKELFDRVQEVLSGKRHPHPTKTAFPFNNLISCGVCECKVLGEEKKKRYHYYHCTFSKGRHADGTYIREEKLAEMLEEPVKRVTLPPTIANWLVEALEEKSKGASTLQENRRNVLQTQLKKTHDRLNKLYDLRIDGELPEDVFKAKEAEYKGHAVELQAQVNDCGTINPENWRRGLKALELSKVLHSQYERADYQEKATILKLIASNYTLQNKTLRPTYRKPFNWIAEGLSCTDWLPDMDSNHDCYLQRVVCYRYTIREWLDSLRLLTMVLSLSKRSPSCATKQVESFPATTKYF